MRRSHTLTFPINCGYAAAYDFLSDPSTFGEWAGVAAGSYREIKETGQWTGLASNGEWRYRFYAAQQIWRSRPRDEFSGRQQHALSDAADFQ